MFHRLATSITRLVGSNKIRAEHDYRGARLQGVLERRPGRRGGLRGERDPGALRQQPEQVRRVDIDDEQAAETHGGGREVGNQGRAPVVDRGADSARVGTVAGRSRFRADVRRRGEVSGFLDRFPEVSGDRYQSHGFRSVV